MGCGGTDVSSFGIEDDDEVSGFGGLDDLGEQYVAVGGVSLKACGLGFDDSDMGGDGVEGTQAEGAEVIKVSAWGLSEVFWETLKDWVDPDAGAGLGFVDRG